MSFVTTFADSAVGRAFIEHGQDLLRFLSRRRRYAAEDHKLARETYARLVRMPVEDLARDPQAYLFRVAGNLLHEFELERQPDSAVRRLWSVGGGTGASPARGDGAAEQAERGARVRKLLEELNPLSRTALILHRRDGMSFEQIGDHLGLPAARVRQAFAAGLQQFCRRMSDSR